MSRSKRKHFKTGICSNKIAKQNANRLYRRICRIKLHMRLPEDVNFPLFREVSDIWDFPSEDKFYFGNTEMASKFLRK